MMSENEAENLVVIMHGPMSMRRERVLNSGRIVRDDGSHYESEQLEVKWPTTTAATAIILHIKATAAKRQADKKTTQNGWHFPKDEHRFLMMTGNPL